MNYDIRTYDSIDSTNTEALRLINEVEGATVFYAKTQTAGRGQRGNKWLSRPGENLTFTLALKFGLGQVPELKIIDQYTLNQGIALAITDYLDSIGISSMIKWPNDIYVGDKKICGILIENGLSSTNIKHSIIGIGLNINQEIFSPDIPNPTSVVSECGKKVNTEDALRELLSCIDVRITSIQKKEDIRKAYLNKLYRKDEVHSYIDQVNKVHFEGRIIGITEDFRLSIETRDEIRNFAFKELGYIISSHSSSKD